MPSILFAPADEPAAISCGRLRSHSLANGSFCFEHRETMGVKMKIEFNFTYSSRKLYLDYGCQVLFEGLLLLAHFH